MARSSESFNRRERERNKKQKADAKRERRLTRNEPSDDSADDSAENAVAPGEVDERDIIRQLEELTSSFDSGDLEFEEYEQQRADLLAQLVVE